MYILQSRSEMVKYYHDETNKIVKYCWGFFSFSFSFFFFFSVVPFPLAPTHAS